VAYLALKHRRNKNGGQRIVVFVGSPIEDNLAALKKVGGGLNKNNVRFPLARVVSFRSLTCTYFVTYSALCVLADCGGRDQRGRDR